jgi:hypothetical protein
VRIAAAFVLCVLGQNDASAPASPDESAAYLDVRPASGPRGSWADRFRQLAEVRLAAASDPVERAAWLRALLQLGVCDHPALALEAAQDRSPLERYVLILALVFRERQLRPGAELPARSAPLIADLAAHHVEITTAAQSADWPWSDSFNMGLLQLFSLLPEAALDRVASACARLISEAQNLIFAGETILGLVLGEARPAIPGDPCALSRGRLEIAHTFLAEPARSHKWWFWDKHNGNASAACRQFGVPHDRVLWMRWLRKAQ